MSLKAFTLARSTCCHAQSKAAHPIVNYSELSRMRETGHKEAADTLCMLTCMDSSNM